MYSLFDLIISNYFIDLFFDFFVTRFSLQFHNNFIQTDELFICLYFVYDKSSKFIFIYIAYICKLISIIDFVVVGKFGRVEAEVVVIFIGVVVLPDLEED